MAAKIHLVPNKTAGAICNAKVTVHHTQQFAVYTLAEFKALPKDERCVRCETTLKRLRNERRGNKLPIARLNPQSKIRTSKQLDTFLDAGKLDVCTKCGKPGWQHEVGRVCAT